MPFNGRRRSFKIVAPLDQSREQEIAGGLKNALDRGEDLAKAKQSFLNAGYKPEEVEAAAQKMQTMTSQIGQQVAAPTDAEMAPTQPQQAAQPTQPQQAAQPLPTTTTTAKVPGQKKQLSKKFIIILIISGVSSLLIFTLLVLFWNKIF